MREIVPDLINYKSWMASASTTRWETPGELLAAVEMLEGPISAMRALQREHPDLASYLPPEPYADVVASIIATAWNELGASWKAVFEEGLDGLPRLRGALNELFAVLRSPVSQRALGMPKEGDSFGRLLEQLAVYDALAKELTVLEVELRALDAEVGNVMQEIEEVTKVFRAEDGDAEAVDAARRWLEQAAVKLEAAATGAELRLAEVSIQGTAGHKGMQECLQATLYCRGRAKCCRLLLELRLALDNKLGEKAQGLLLEVKGITGSDTA